MNYLFQGISKNLSNGILFIFSLIPRFSVIWILQWFILFLNIIASISRLSFTIPILNPLGGWYLMKLKSSIILIKFDTLTCCLLPKFSTTFLILPLFFGIDRNFVQNFIIIHIPPNFIRFHLFNRVFYTIIIV